MIAITFSSLCVNLQFVHDYLAFVTSRLDNSSSDIASITTKHVNNDLEQNTPTSSSRMFIKIQESERNHYVFIEDMDQLATLIEKLEDKFEINMEDHHLTFDQKPLLDLTTNTTRIQYQEL